MLDSASSFEIVALMFERHGDVDKGRARGPPARRCRC
jgi:hypothetical protein